MFIFMLIGMYNKKLILIAETIIEPKTRLTWPYGDKVPGVILQKFHYQFFVLNGNSS